MSKGFEGFEKLHIAHIASYILDDSEVCEPPEASFYKRLSEANQELEDVLAERIDDFEILHYLAGSFARMGKVVRDVFFEAGILCGVKLARALSPDTDSYAELLRHLDQKD